MKVVRKTRTPSRSVLDGEVAELRLRLGEAEETLRAIRSGEVDALMVAGEHGDQVFTLEGAGHAYRVLIESMNEGALTLMADGMILYANQHFAKMVKCPLEEVMGRSFARFLSPPDATTLRALLIQDDNVGVQLQVLLAAVDGSQTPAQLSVRTLARHNISPATIGMVVTDLSETQRLADLKETERLYTQVREQAAELERRVTERTQQLQRANLELEAFESSVSHDLRGPLRHIMGFANMLDLDHASEMPEEARSYIKKIVSSVEKMEGLIAALLEFSRMSKQCLALESVDIAQMCREMYSEMKADLGDRQIDLIVGPLPACRADPVLLRQVLANLLGNAIKYSGKRQRAVIQVSSDETPGGGSVVYSIKDNGVGFDMRYADKLFTVFHRLHDTRDFEGTGVGLTTVKRIIERHGGRIWAQSAIDAGATFFFTLGDPASS